MALLSSVFGSEQRDLIGIDISSSSIKVVELSKTGTRYRLEAYGSERMPSGAMSDQEISDVEAVGNAIANAIKKSGSKQKAAAISVTSSAAITKVIEMSADLNDDEMEQQIRFEADQYIPYPIEEVNLDFQILGPSDRNEEMVRVLLAACKSDTIDLLAGAIAIAGLKPLIVDVDTYALENACELITPHLPDNGNEKTIAMVDIGDRNCKLSVINNLETIYTRDQAFGGNQLTEDIKRHFDMSTEDAERAKLSGELPAEYKNELLPNFINDLTQHISRALQLFYSSSSHQGKIDHVIIGGGCASIEGIDSSIQHELNTSTLIAKPLSSLGRSLKARKGNIERDEASYLMAAGLALRAFDS